MKSPQQKLNPALNYISAAILLHHTMNLSRLILRAGLALHEKKGASYRNPSHGTLKILNYFRKIFFNITI